MSSTADINPYDPSHVDTEPTAGVESVDRDDNVRRHRTRKAVLWLAGVPAGLFLLAILTPHAPPKDAIAVATIVSLGMVFPSLLVLGLIAPLLVFARAPVARGCARCLVRACFFSAAAMVVTGDFWLFGVFAGLKWRWIKVSAPLAATAIVLTLLQIPSEKRFQQWKQSAT